MLFGSCLVINTNKWIFCEHVCGSSAGVSAFNFAAEPLFPALKFSVGKVLKQAQFLAIVKLFWSTMGSEEGVGKCSPLHAVA